MKVAAQELRDLNETDDEPKVMDTPGKDTVSIKSIDSDDCLMLTPPAKIDR